MGQNARTGQSQRGVITLDWMLLVVGAIAALLLVGTTVRITIGETDARRLGDLFVIHADDDLLAFQDFTFGAPGWAPEATSDRLAGLGPVLGPFQDDAVQRGFEIPVGTDQVQVFFDVHLLGTWEEQGALHLSLAENHILTLPAPDAEGQDVMVTDHPGIDVLTERRVVVPDVPDAALPGTVDAFVTQSVRIRLSADFGSSLVLRLMADDPGDGQWTLDNLTVVATSSDSRT